MRIKTFTLIFIVFSRPLFLMWCLDYLQDDFGLPELSYWKCFWLIFAVHCFFPAYQRTESEFNASFNKR